MHALRHDRRGFTIVELLVVVAIIALLASLLLVAIQSLTASGMYAVDQTRQRGLVTASIDYATSHEGRLFSPRTWKMDATDPDCDECEITDDFIDTISDRLWVRSYDGGGHIRVEDQGNRIIELAAALVDGEAWTYIGNAKGYKSPMDPTDRIRSYSFNGFTGVLYGADDYCGFVCETGFVPGETFLSAETLAQIPQPANTMGTIGEEETDAGGGRNIGGWVMDPVMLGGSLPRAYWFDAPAYWAPDRFIFSMYDGSTQSRKREPDLMERFVTASGDQYGPSQGAAYAIFRNKLLPGRMPRYIIE